MMSNGDFLAGIGAAPAAAKKTRAKTKRKKAAKSKGLVVSQASSYLQNNLKQIAVGFCFMGLVMAGGINAMFLQQAKHPSPYLEAPLISKNTVGSIEKKEIRLDNRPTAPVSDPLVMDIQRHLAARGYYDSTIDGIMGARTRAAIGLYQRAFKENVTNKASRALLEHIRLSPPEAEYHAAARKRLADQREKVLAEVDQKDGGEIIDNPEQIKKLQRALSELGFQDVTDDGVIGPITRAAVKKFKKQRGIGRDGTITAAVFDELVRMKKL